MILDYSVFIGCLSTYTSSMPQQRQAVFEPRAVAVALTAFAALAVAMGIGRFAFTPLLPMMQEDFGVSVAEGGWLASANYLGYLVGALSAIVLPVRHVRAIRVGLLVIGISTVGMAFDYGFWWWLALRGLAGVASAWVLVFVSSWALERLSMLGRPQLGGAVYAGVGTGIVAAGVACLALMALGAGSANAWLTLGFAALVATAITWQAIEPANGVQSASKSGQEKARWTSEYWRLVLCYGAFGFGYIIPATFLPVMAKEVISDPMIFGWAWPVFGAAAVASTLLAARAATFLSHRGVWILAGLTMALGVVFPLGMPGLGGILVAALFVGGTFMVITMAGMQEARRVACAQARPLMAAMTSSFALGQIVGPLCVTYLIKTSGGFGVALVLASMLLALSALVLRAASGARRMADG
jgi:predicted MFS family arabinose efflux permease